MLNTPNAGLDGVSGAFTLTTGTASGGSSGMVDVTTGQATSGNGGSVRFTVGTGDDGDGGAFSVTAGKTTANSVMGGLVEITSGYASADLEAVGGHMTLDAGQGESRTGGSISITTDFGGANDSAPVQQRSPNPADA